MAVLPTSYQIAQMKLLVIANVRFDTTDQLLVSFFFCIRQILEKKWE
jgi:hypothetical protein